LKAKIKHIPTLTVDNRSRRMKILTEMSKIEKNKKEEVKVKLVVQKQQYLISLAPLSRMAFALPSIK